MRQKRANGKIAATIDLLDLTLMELENYLYVRCTLSDHLFSVNGIIETRRLRSDRARLLLAPCNARSNFHK